MKYKYLCPTCKTQKIIEMPIIEDLPEKILCPKCKEKMIYDPKQFNSLIKIPYPMRATTEEGLNYKKRFKKKFY
jgi:hypothetical protein